MDLFALLWKRGYEKLDLTSTGNTRGRRHRLKIFITLLPALVALLDLEARCSVSLGHLNELASRPSRRNSDFCTLAQAFNISTKSMNEVNALSWAELTLAVGCYWSRNSHSIIQRFLALDTLQCFGFTHTAP